MIGVRNSSTARDNTPISQLPRKLRLEVADRRNQLTADHLQRREPPDVDDLADRGPEAARGEPSQVVEDPANVFAVRSDVEAVVAGLEDLVVVAALALAVGT